MELRHIGPYVVEKEIGAGGMGTVYLARHVDTLEPAAVKVLPPALARQEGFVLRFTREIEALQKLANPHIVRLLGSGEEHDTYYFAMEYVTGENLAQRLKRDKKIPWREAVDIALQLCSALKAAHDAGVIHRDLKPSNILLAPDGVVKLTDFGVAQLFAADKLTITGGIVGTAEYMSPEQAQGHRATKRSDLYSLGAVLYAMLTGRPPFTGSTAIEILQKHRFGQFDLPGRYTNDVPSWLDDVVRQLLEKDPDKRLPDAFVLLRRLQEVVNKVDLRSNSEVTMLAPEGPPPDGTTMAASDSPGDDMPGQATLMRNLVRDEIRRGEPTAWWQKLLNNTWVLVALLAGLIAIVWWAESSRVSPDQHLAAAQALLDGPAGGDWLKARDEHLRPLLKSDPERWGPVVEPMLEEIESYELEQRLVSTRKRGRKTPPLTEAERLLGEVRRLWDAGQFAEAQRRLTATQRLLESDPQAAPLARLAARWQDALAEANAERPSPAEYVREVLSRADATAKTDPATARGLWQSIVELYANDLSVASEVAEAQRRLNELPR